MDTRQATLSVFTLKDGLLSRVAHDLELTTDFSVAFDDGKVVALVNPQLKVLHALKGGQPDPTALTRRNCEEIEANIRDAVLETARFPVVRFEALLSERVGGELVGDLTLHGVTRRVRLSLVERADDLVAEARVHQPDFAVRPFTAMMGTLKVKAEVRVVVRLPRALLPG